MNGVNREGSSFERDSKTEGESTDLGGLAVLKQHLLNQTIIPHTPAFKPQTYFMNFIQKKSFTAHMRFFFYNNSLHTPKSPLKRGLFPFSIQLFINFLVHQHRIFGHFILGLFHHEPTDGRDGNCNGAYHQKHRFIVKCLN